MWIVLGVDRVSFHHYRRQEYFPFHRRSITLTTRSGTSCSTMMRYFVGIIFVAQFLLRYTESEQTREFTIVENVPTGTLVGLLDDPDARATTYLIVPSPGSAVDSDLLIDQATKEIRTRVVLDRELRNSYTFVAIPSDDGENIRVLIRVKDENDNAPKFVAPSMSVEFPENTPRDVKRTLNPARDSDLGIFNVQQYKIVSGNTNNAFRLSSHRERDEVLYLDLQVNGFLDRETTPFYRLVIDAYDGGNPKLKGSMTVNVTIVDVNDNQPIFNQSRYFASVPENVTVGTNVVQLFASDMDEGDNGRVSYYINRRQSDRERFFEIDRNSGIVSVNKGLDFETKDVYELVVVARDGGAQPLETTTFVTLRVLDVNDNRPTINLIFLSDDASPKVSEDAQPGKLVARISVNDPDSKTEYSDVNVTLEGGGRFFGLRTRDHMVYFLYVESDLDREIGPNFTLSVTATDQGQPPLQVSRSFVLHVTDVNDHVPRFTKNMYFASVQETADPGTSVAQLTAMDADEGNNSLVSYSIRDTPDTRSQWFEIDAKTGLITTKSHVDCETDAAPRVVVVASDAGSPPLSSSVTLTITILDVNDNEPIFDQSYYHVAVNESVGVGHCLLTVGHFFIFSSACWIAAFCC
uniref:Cadherin domain-containing protein n=1 Tax=Strigamia maritima TaxID=126957 RepID=T1ING0_STRMM